MYVCILLVSVSWFRNKFSPILETLGTISKECKVPMEKKLKFVLKMEKLSKFDQTILI